MVLSPQGSKPLCPPSRKRICHSTFNDNRAEKRFKEVTGVDGIESAFYDDPDEKIISEAYHENTPEAEGVESCDDSSYLHCGLTGLEKAYLPAKTDKEAIFEYEYVRATDDAYIDVRACFDSKNRTRSKGSIYVDAFNLALGTVLEDESHLFDNIESGIFDQWKSLDYEAQYLYVRLFLRKTSTWHRIQGLAYHGDIQDLPSAASNLQALRDLRRPSSPQLNASEVIPREPFLVGNNFRFADTSETDITTLEEALSLLSLEELKAIAKEAKVQGKNKKELSKAFLQMSQKQSGLGWVTLSRFDSGQTSSSNGSRKGDKEGERNIAANDCDTEKEGEVANNRNKHYLQKILASVGSCIRLSLSTLKLFERVHLVFNRSTEWTEKSLTTIILERISLRNFPRYIVSRSASIFASRSTLIEFEAALRTQYRVNTLLESTGAPPKEGLEQVLSIFDDIYPRWKNLIEIEQQKEDSVYVNGEGAYLRRFSPAWVYTRIIHKTTFVLGRLKRYEHEHQILAELLRQKLLHVSRRGAWYQRKALLEEHYMAALSQATTGDLTSQKRQWKRVSLQTCEQGLQDRDCHVIYHYDLQRRIGRLEKCLKVAKRVQHDFGHVALYFPIKRTIFGTLVKRTGQSLESAKDTKTIWIDEQEGGCECSVESMCLSQYRRLGWRGYHSEGGIIRTLFAYLFFDVLFTYIPNVFQTQFQTCPLDLHTDAFYTSRVSEINHRLVEISNGDAERLIREVDQRERKSKTCIIGLDWGFERDDLIEIARCFQGSALAMVCKVMAQDYHQRGGGVPDLFLWNSHRKEVMFVEVKSVNDRLSDTQRLWIHTLISSGVTVEICYAVAKEEHTK